MVKTVLYRKGRYIYGKLYRFISVVMYKYEISVYVVINQFVFWIYVDVLFRKIKVRKGKQDP